MLAEKRYVNLPVKKQRHLENLFVVPKGILPEEFPRDAVVFPEPEDLHESQRWLLVGAAVA
jgi:hypothetical protein